VKSSDALLSTIPVPLKYREQPLDLEMKSEHDHRIDHQCALVQQRYGSCSIVTVSTLKATEEAQKN
jgi:hypothetical protein